MTTKTVTTTMLGGLLLGATPTHAAFILSLESGGITETVEDGAGNALGGVATFNADVRTVPEPTTLALVGIGLARIGFARGRRLNSQSPKP